MTLTLKIAFLTGRYHATDWNHQVNEGVLEWPPSPWRLMRALVASSYRLPNPPQRPNLKALMESLSSVLPHYYLPPVAEGHTRHYMPLRKEGENRTSLVFDAFLALGHGALSEDATVWVRWPDLLLPESHTEILAELCHHISYLGRAESWAEITVENNAQPTGTKAQPLSGVEQRKDAKRVKLLTPLTATELAASSPGISPTRKRGKPKWQVPQDVLSALEVDIGDLHRQGWSGVPGARWVFYTLDEPPPPRRTISRNFTLQGEPAFARFALSSNVLPKLPLALSIGERFRRALMRWSDGHVLFSGRDPERLDETGNKQPVQGHSHCWYLPEDVDGDGYIDHVLVYATKGFDEPALWALRQLRKVWSQESKGGELHTILIQLGRVKDYTAPVGNSIPGVSPLIAKGTTWHSLTPMVLPRHPKKNPALDPDTGMEIDEPEHQVLSQILCLRKDGLLKFSEPEGWRWQDNIIRKPEGFCRHYPWYDYRRQRENGNGSHAGTKAYWVQVTFPEPVVGPMALGYAAHFGLGVFLPLS